MVVFAHRARHGRRPTARVSGSALAPGVALLTVLAVGCADTSFVVTPVPARPDLIEHTMERESPWATAKIAVVDVDGLIANDNTPSLLNLSRDNPVVLFRERLELAARDPAVRAVVVRINSPGGGVTASDLMHGELTRFREKTGKPVIAALLDTAASGGYYVACAADEIHAQPTTVTGSIGVIMLLPEFSGIMSRLGVRVNAIKSGPMKDSGSLFRELGDEERQHFQGLVDRLYDRFVAVVVASRKDLCEARVRALADGRVYLGSEAKEAGLVDEVCSLRETIQRAKDRAGIAQRPVRVVAYGRAYQYRPNIYAETGAGPSQVNLVNLNLPHWATDPSPRLMYLWAPQW